MMSNDNWSRIMPQLRRQSTARLGDVLAAQLEELIEKGELDSGDRFPPERELAEILNVSRTTVREALQQLVIKGLIERRPGRGTVVLPGHDGQAIATLEDLQDADKDVLYAFDFRLVIEPAIAANAAVRATKADLVRLDDILRLMEMESSAEVLVRLDQQFHETIAKACHNPLLVKLVELTADWVKNTRAKNLEPDQRRAIAVRGHQEIYRMLIKRDPTGASEAMSKHIRDIIEVIKSESGS